MLTSHLGEDGSCWKTWPCNQPLGCTVGRSPREAVTAPQTEMQQTAASGPAPADLVEMLPWQSRVPAAWELSLAARGYAGVCPCNLRCSLCPARLWEGSHHALHPVPATMFHKGLASLLYTQHAPAGAAASLPVARMSSTHPQVQPSSALSLCFSYVGREMPVLPLPHSLKLETILSGLTDDCGVT